MAHRSGNNLHASHITAESTGIWLFVTVDGVKYVGEIGIGDLEGTFRGI